jgi:hypothetical protein
VGEATEGRKEENNVGARDGGGGGRGGGAAPAPAAPAAAPAPAAPAAAAAGFLEEAEGEVKMVCGAYHLLLFDKVSNVYKRTWKIKTI